MTEFEGRYFGTFSYVPGAPHDRFALMHLESTDGKIKGFYGIGNGVLPDEEKLLERTPVIGILQDDALLLEVEEKCAQHMKMTIRVHFPNAMDPACIMVSLMEGAIQMPMQRV